MNSWFFFIYLGEKKEVEKPENDETSEEETVEMELPDLDEIKSDLTDEKEDVWKF